MLYLPNWGKTLGFDYSQSTRREKIGVDGQLLHPLYDRYVGGERCHSGKHHLD